MSNISMLLEDTFPLFPQGRVCGRFTTSLGLLQGRDEARPCY